MRLLHHDRPIERRDRAVGAEHLHAVLALVYGEFLGGGQLRLAALVHKIADDLQVLHVLAGHVLRSAGSHQPALRVHNVGNQAAAADFLQPANQKLQIHDRAHHAQKTPAIADGTADQQNRPRRLAVSHLQRLPVVGAAIAGGVIGMLQFALQKSVGCDASGRNSFGIGVQQRGIGEFIGGGNKVLQQCAQLRRSMFLLPMSPPLAT